MSFQSSLAGITTVCLTVFATAGNTTAEPPSFANPKSVPGKPILSTPVDPYMTAEQEYKIHSVLAKPNSELRWSNEILEDVVLSLSKFVPAMVNRRALEDEGLPADLALTRVLDGDRLPLGANLLTALSEHDLTFIIRHGRLIITTATDAESEENLATRVYDVTPLVVVRNLGERPVAEFQNLMSSIQNNIGPNGWEVMGGSSTMAPSTVRDRALLTITTTTVSHLTIQSYLNQLNTGPDTIAEQDLSNPWQQHLLRQQQIVQPFNGMMNISP